MNIYECLNKITEYIEKHLTDEIDNNVLSKMMGVNLYTMKRIFSLLCNISLADYIRRRKLSEAAYFLYHDNMKVIDVAFKFGYDNATSFSRAFEAYHGIKPSKVKKEQVQLKNFPRIEFSYKEFIPADFSYRVVFYPDLELYGLGVSTSLEKVKKDAPLFYQKMNQQYGQVEYAITFYKDEERFLIDSYWCLYKNKKKEFVKKRIPASKWLSFQINTQKTQDIQKTIDLFYQKFLPSCKFNLKDLPEIEYYHDGICEFLIAIL